MHISDSALLKSGQVLWSAGATLHVSSLGAVTRLALTHELQIDLTCNTPPKWISIHAATYKTIQFRLVSNPFRDVILQQIRGFPSFACWAQTLTKIMLLRWDWSYVVPLGILSAMVPQPLQKLKFGWNDIKKSCTTITFDKLYSQYKVMSWVHQSPYRSW